MPTTPSRRSGLGLLLALLLAVGLGVSAAAPAAAAGPVSISGVILGSDGAPSPGQHVQAWKVSASGGIGDDSAVQVTTELDGSFVLRGLTAGQRYKLRVNWDEGAGNPDGTSPSHEGFLTNRSPDSLSKNAAHGAIFVPGAAGITGLRFRLEPATTISGRVAWADGAPAAGVRLYIQTETKENDLLRERGFIALDGDPTRADGSFTASGIEYLGGGITSFVIGLLHPEGWVGYVGGDSTTGLVPIDAARRFPAGAGPIVVPPIVLPQAKLPVEQMLLSSTLGGFSGRGEGQGQLLQLSGGTLAAYTLDNGKLSQPLGIRSGLAGQQVYAPGNWGGLDFHRDDIWVERNDLISVDRRGDMYLYRGDGYGHLRPAEKIGNGWSGYRVIPAGDLTRDGNADLLAIDRKGDLRLYRGDGKGGFLYPYPRVGNGWNGFQLHAAGDLNGDNRIDILSIDAKGRLWMYAGNGNGTFQMRKQAGHGWSGFTLAAGQDLDRFEDSTGRWRNWDADIVGRNDATGQLYFYSGRGNGTFAPAKLIATGW